MATGSVTWNGGAKETGLTYDTTLNWNRSEWASKLDEIPRFARIDKMRLFGTHHSSSGNGKYKLRLDDSTTGASTILAEGNASKSKVSFTVYIHKQTNLNGADSGYVNGDIRFNFYRGTLNVPYYYYVDDIGILWDFTYPTYTINATAGEGGTVSGNTGTFDVTLNNQTKTIKATANSGYKFVKWVDSNGNTVSNNASYSITVSHNTISAFATTVNYTAVFEKNVCTATFVNYDGTILQTIEVNSGATPSYTGTTPTKDGTYYCTYTFSGWQPALSAITSDTTYTAQFTAKYTEYPVDTPIYRKTGVDENGNPTIEEDNTVGTATGAGTYKYGDVVRVTATANDGYKFFCMMVIYWGDINNPDNTISYEYVYEPVIDITVNGNVAVAVIFEKDGINNIYIGTAKPTAIYVGTTPVKAVYVGTTLIYQV